MRTHVLLQVLGEIFASLHMAEVGSAAEGAADPQLPQRIRLTGKQRPAYRQLPSSIVLDIFGLEVQVWPSPVHSEASLSVIVLSLSSGQTDSSWHSSWMSVIHSSSCSRKLVFRLEDLLLLSIISRSSSACIHHPVRCHRWLCRALAAAMALH